MMKITKMIYNSLLYETPPLPPETGGIIGSQNKIIMRAFFDKGNTLLPASSVYEPNIMVLNQVIANWERNNIAFSGIFHSHYSHDTVLSMGDKTYIRKIMYAMPPQIHCLYFPIVLPRKTIIGYRASRSLFNVDIVCEKIEII